MGLDGSMRHATAYATGKMEGTTLKTLPLVIALAVLSTVAPLSADAQPDATDPYMFTCADLLNAQPGDERVRANMMIYWSVGYMYGRFGGGPEAPARADNYQQSVSDMVNAFQQVCPNVPDMPIAAFVENIADDLERSMQQ